MTKRTKTKHIVIQDEMTLNNKTPSIPTEMDVDSTHVEVKIEKTNKKIPV